MSNEKSICIIQFSDRAFCKGSNHGERCGLEGEILAIDWEG